MQFFRKKMREKFGGKEKVRIFAARLRNNGKFTDNTERENEVKKIEIKVCRQTASFFVGLLRRNFKATSKNEIK